MPATPFRNVCNIIFGVCATPNFSISRHGWLNFRMRVSKAVLVFLVEIHTFSYQKKLVTKTQQNRKELLVTFLSLKNSPISSNHQNVHQNWWKFNRKFKSPKHSPKLVKILAKIHWKMNVVSYLWDHIDFLQNCHQFWWFSSIFANFCDFFIEIYSDLLKCSPKLVTKKPKIKKNIFTRNGDIFVT